VSGDWSRGVAGEAYPAFVREHVVGSTTDCVICGQDQDHRPMCYRGLNVCCGACEAALLAEVLAEVRGPVEAVVAEGTDHIFVPTMGIGPDCVVCGRNRALHGRWAP